MYAEERGWVPIRNPDRRIQRQHICGHSRLIHPRLYVEAPEYHILDDDLGLVRPPGAPEDQREHREEDDESEGQTEVQPDAAVRGGIEVVVVIVIVFSVGRGAKLKVSVNLLPGAGMLRVLDGGRKSGGGGLAGVVNRRAVVVVRRAEGARAVRHFLDVVLRWTLHVVQRPPRRPRWRRRVQARHLRV